MIFITPPPKREPPKHFKIICSECGNEAALKDVFKNGKVLFRCPGCGISEKYEPKPK